MFIVTIDTTKLQARIADMVAQLQETPPKMLEQMTAWQRDDMRRKVPESATPDENTVTTAIWRRGRPWLFKPSPSHSAYSHPFKGSHSSRPILRPILYDQWRARMVNLLALIKW